MRPSTTRVRRTRAPKRDVALDGTNEGLHDVGRMAALRAVFLCVLADEMPEVVRDLAARAATGATPARVAADWACAWRLCDESGRPADWIVTAAVDSLGMWASHPTVAGRAFALPSGGAWWPDDPHIETVTGAALWRDREAFAWLAVALCGQRRVPDIVARIDGRHDVHAVRLAIVRKARELGLARPPTRRGRPPTQARTR